MKYSLRLFFFCSGTYFSLFLLAKLAIDEPQKNPESIAVMTFLGALLFGGCMSAFLSWRQKKALDKLGLSLQDYSSHFRSEVILLLPPEIALNACVDSLQFLEKSKIKKVDKVAGTILAHVGPSRNSWGEELTIRLKPLPHRTCIVVQSIPRVPLNIVDCGKNASNVLDIIANLKQYEQPNVANF